MTDKPTYRGKPIKELSREKLIKALEHACRVLHRLDEHNQQDHEAMAAWRREGES